MLSIKENLLETLKKDGHPDRFVKGWEFVGVLFPAPYYMADYPLAPDTRGYDQYGVYWDWPVGQMGPFPVHDEEHRILKDICEWREIVKKPYIPEDPGFWGMLNGMAAGARAQGKLVAALHPQGIFERLHALMGMEDCMCNFYEEPEEMEELINFLVEIEIDFAKVMIEKVGIEAVLHHDDWGSGETTFMSKDMFDEFILPAYKKIYGFYKENGILIIHHNDGWAASLVPSMIEMGIDIWQGVLRTNDIPALLDKYEGQITFMGGIRSAEVDLPDSDPAKIEAEVEELCAMISGKRSFIPALTAGVPASSFPGNMDLADAAVEKMNEKYFK